MLSIIIEPSQKYASNGPRSGTSRYVTALRYEYNPTALRLSFWAIEQEQRVLAVVFYKNYLFEKILLNLGKLVSTYS